MTAPATVDTGSTAPDGQVAGGDRTGADSGAEPGGTGGDPGRTGGVPGADPGRTGGVPASLSAPSLSPSRAADFLSCPLKYRFRVVDRITEAPSPEAVRGTVVHAVLERLFDLPAGERTLDRATAMVGPEWARLLAEDPRAAQLQAASDVPLGAATEPEATEPGATEPGVPEPGATEPGTAGAVPGAGPDGPAEVVGDARAGADTELPGWLAVSGRLLATYFGLEDPGRVEPAERELRVQTELDGGLVLRGFVDRLDVAPDGAMRIVDYKTGRAPGEGWEARALFQMRFYALVLWRLRGRMPRLLQLMYLGSGEVVRYAPDEHDLLATERKLRAVWSAIESSMRRRDFRPNPSRLCDWCDHKVRCPAWGGTAPDYPEPVPASEPVLPSVQGSGR